MTPKATYRSHTAVDSCGRRAKICATPPMPRSRKNSNNWARSMSMDCRETRLGASAGTMNRRWYPISSTTTTRSSRMLRAATWVTSPLCVRVRRCRLRKSRFIRQHPADRQACIRESPGLRARRRERRGRRRAAAVRLIRSATSGPVSADNARDPASRLTASAVRSPRSQRTRRARIRVARPGKRRSGRAISVATAAKSIPGPATRRPAAAVRSSTANVRRRPRHRQHRTARAAMWPSAAPAVWPAR